MRRLAAGLVFALVCPPSVLAQERDRSVERIRLALEEQPPLSMGGPPPPITPTPRTFGIFTLVPPTRSGEFVRVSVPIGELVSQAAKGMASANRRRQEAASRRKVQAALKAFAAGQPNER
jgi:hypothetical protein